MAFTPDSTVYLLDTPLDSLNKNQIRFTNATAQAQYFVGRRKHTFEDVTYTRKDKAIRVGKHIDSLWDVNYVMYRNKNFSTKWFYAFITKMEYVNERVTDVFIETDVYQTWLEECTLKTSFVMREHVADDTIGLHLVDEQIEYGEYKVGSTGFVEKMGPTWNILAVSDTTPFDLGAQVGNIYGKVMTGLTYFPFPNTNAGATWLRETILKYAEAGKPDAIVMIFTVPQLILGEGYTMGEPIESGAPYGFALKSFTKPFGAIDGYTPKNGKLHTHPYKYFYLSNGTGQSAEYYYEDFRATDRLEMPFILFGSIMPNPTIMMSPSDYKNADASYEYGLTLSGYPLGSWTSDSYVAWWAQNGASVGVAIAGSALAIVGGIATMNPMAIGGGALGVGSQISQITKAAKQPDQAKGQVGSGSLLFGDNSLDFRYAHMNIKAQYAKQIDDYLTQYGYKVNKLKVPEVASRTQWNYVQTIDINIDGAIPSDDMVKLKNMYNSGVTFWHNPSNFLNYSLNNPIR